MTEGRRPKATNKEVEKILRAAEEQGFVVRQSKANHFQVYTAEGQWVTNFPSTPGNDAKRSILNSLSPLKRAGFKPRR
jgi:predicted RNA binding protein YcfA (HicA-like mRNA interferase family)